MSANTSTKKSWLRCVGIINFETAITKSNDYWKHQGINYRMHPENVPCIKAAKIDCCAIANNDILDWGYAGLVETLSVLEHVNVKGAGVGRNIAEAKAPAVTAVNDKGRVLVFAYVSPTSGVTPNAVFNHLDKLPQSTFVGHRCSLTKLSEPNPLNLRQSLE